MLLNVHSLFERRQVIISYSAQAVVTRNCPIVAGTIVDIYDRTIQHRQCQLAIREKVGENSFVVDFFPQPPARFSITKGLVACMMDYPAGVYVAKVSSFEVYRSMCVLDLAAPGTVLERRKHPRLYCDYEVRFSPYIYNTLSGDLLSGRFKDLSAGGAKVVSDVGLRAGSCAYLSIQLPGDARTFKMLARVMRTERDKGGRFITRFKFVDK